MRGEQPDANGVSVATDAREAPQPASQVWKRRALIALAVLAYEVIWVATAFDKVNPTDLDIFFFPAAKIAVAGHPFDIYQLRVGLIYPNANGPLGLAPVILAEWIASLRGWANDVILRRALLFAITGVFQLLAGWEAARLVERFGGRLRGTARLLPYVVVLFAPELWLSALYYGHVEQTIAVWLILASVRVLCDHRALAAGALLGLALLARSDVALVALPVALTLLARRRFMETARLAIGVVVTTVAGLAPFLIADAHDTIFSLVTFRSALPVGGGNVWSLSDALSFLAIGQRYDAWLVVGLATALTTLTLAFRRTLDVFSPDFYLLLALTSLCFALLIKTLWPYYYQEAALMATAWALARSVEPLSALWRAWRASLWRLTGALALAWAPRIVILVCAVFAELSLEATNYGGWIAPWSTLEGLMSILAVAVAVGALFAADTLMPRIIGGPRGLRRDILREIARSAQADGEGQSLGSR